MVIIFGVVNPLVRHISMARSVSISEKSFYTAEAAIEDVIYRYKFGLPVVSSNTFEIDGSSVSVTVTDGLNNKVVVATGDTNNYFRKIEAHLTAGAGVSFFYGLQTGTGGIFMSNNSIVKGNVYANGNISGNNGARITGSAYAANSASLNTNQSNELPLPPTESIQFGSSYNAQDVAQSFMVTETAPINKIAVYLKKVGTPGNLTVRIVNNNGDKPGTATLAQGTMSASLVTTSFGWVEIPLSSNPELVPGQVYWLVLDGGNNTSKYYIIGANSDYSNGVAKIGNQSTSVWNNTSPSGLDFYFKIFLGGLTGTINKVLIGSDAHAHTVTNSTVTANLYCQTGSGNNKSCNTSLPDPSPEAFPISDANIAEWKSAAESGGTVGSLNLSGTSSSLGPKKINGNLNVSNGYVLNVTGTVYVTGDINISNNATVKLSSSYGSNSGVVIADGNIYVSNNAVFAGSGQTGSYILLVSTNNSSNAINVYNNAGTVILNAQKGTINFANNAGAKSAVANRINLSNGATITYESGLINVNFSSGPSGGYDIVKWKEVE